MEREVGPYRIVERLGAGGMGEVYLAEDTRLGRRVALKRLSDATLGEPDARARILREAGAAATLNHPNVAAVYDVLDVAGRAYIVMEYVPGESLADSLHHGGPLPADRVVQLGLQLCDALEEAHRHGVVHRDMKPANVRVTPEGRAKVLDFGLAKRPAGMPVSASNAPAALAESLAFADGNVIGTPAYMAPEVLLGQPADRRSDIYSLGVTLFELAVGYPPFQGSNFMSVALAVLTEPPPPIATLLPGGLGDIVARAMAREPAQRYQSVIAMRRDLESLSAEYTDRPTGPLHVPSSIRERLLGLGRERASLRTTTWLAAAALMLVIAAGTLTVSLRSPRTNASAPSPPVVAVLALPTASDSPAHASLGIGVAAELGGYLSNATRRATIVSSGGVPQEVQAAGVVTAGRNLGASYLVPVIVQVQGGRVQVNAQLLRAGDRAVLGSATERGTLGDDTFFDLQQRLGVRVAGMLEAAVGASPSRPPPPPQPSTVDDFAEYSAAIAMLARRFVAGNLDRAVAALEDVVSRSPGFAAAHAGLSQAYLTQFFETKSPPLVGRALDAAKRAVELDPADVRGIEALALAHHAGGQEAEALTALADGIAAQPRSDALHRLRGEILVRQGRVDEGLAALGEAVRLRPAFADNHTALGLSLYSRGRFDQAIGPLARAVELMPDDPMTHQRLGATFHQLGQLDRALAEYREATRLGGTGPAYANMATILYRQGHYEEALAGYEQSLQRRPGSHQTWRSKGDVLNRLGRTAAARDAWSRAAALADAALHANPSDAQTRAFLAVCRAKLGEAAAARQLAADAMRAAPGNPEILYRGAVVNTLGGRLDEGRALLAQALKAGYSESEAAVDDDLRALRAADKPRAVR